uniref:Zinc ribbon-containing protein n=1 Tax=Marseillevirus sp. TaxID=2809551 RepID=A0AA96IYW1_9VIRU|nr:hypothetical protein MarFTMF_433 [Marseillevirus sp.]
MEAACFEMECEGGVCRISSSSGMTPEPCDNQKSERGLCGDWFCQECYLKSFASEAESRFWGAKNKVGPRDVPLVSQELFWFEKGESEYFGTVADAIRYYR